MTDTDFPPSISLINLASHRALQERLGGATFRRSDGAAIC